MLMVDEMAPAPQEVNLLRARACFQLSHQQRYLVLMTPNLSVKRTESTVKIKIDPQNVLVPLITADILNQVHIPCGRSANT
jgi:hypothetical protein